MKLCVILAHPSVDSYNDAIASGAGRQGSHVNGLDVRFHDLYPKNH